MLALVLGWSGLTSLTLGGVLALVGIAKGTEARQLGAATPLSNLSGECRYHRRRRPGLPAAAPSRATSPEHRPDTPPQQLKIQRWPLYLSDAMQMQSSRSFLRWCPCWWP